MRSRLPEAAAAMILVLLIATIGWTAVVKVFATDKTIEISEASRSVR